MTVREPRPLVTRVVLVVAAAFGAAQAHVPARAGVALLAPTTYSAYSGTDTKAPPPAPVLGAANTSIADPTFGSRILRVTDQNTAAGQSFLPSDAGFTR